MKHQLSKEAKENLRGASTGRPPNGQQRDAENQRRRTHVPQSLRVFMPRTDHFILVQLRVASAEAAACEFQARNTQRGKQERQRVEHESPLVAELRHARAAQECSERERGPSGGLGERIRGVQLFFARNSRENRGPAAGKKRRS